MVVTISLGWGFKDWRTAFGVPLLLLFFSVGQVQAHGGEKEVRLMGQRVGGHDVTVMTAPQNPRVGELHIAVQLIDPKELEYIHKARVIATARLLGNEAAPGADAQAQYREPWHELHLRLERSGRWKVELAVSGPKGEGETSFIVDVSPSSE